MASPHICKQCGGTFLIEDVDLQFYDKISPIFEGKKYQIPPPTLCPQCRRQRRLAWRNERTLYKRACDLCKKEIVTIHAPNHTYPVYCNPCWWSDRWAPLSFGKSYDSSRPFLDQYFELFARVPQRAMVNDDGVMSENSAYTFDVAFSKNCYMCFGMWKAQDCYYCRICDQSRFCVDCEGVKLGSEFVYESVDSQRLYRSAFMSNSENCTDCMFGFDLKGCSDCIGCVSLRQKRFYIFNTPYSEEEYRKQKAALQLNTRTGLGAFEEEFKKFALQFPRKNMNLFGCEDSMGDHLFHCRNVLGYVCTNAEHCRWVDRSDGPRFCYDVLQAGDPELCYECVTVDNGYMNCACLYCNQSHYALYSDNCIQCDSIMGCISLRRKKYCILNMQYTKEEYEKYSGHIAKSMQEEGKFGEFFPVERSPFGYNETNAQESYPLHEETAKEKGWKWATNLPYTTGKETIKQNELPDDIQKTTPGITEEILACSDCNKNYRITPQELDFYRTLDLPVPARCPDSRNRRRLARRNPHHLFQRRCMQCQQEMFATYAPDQKEIVYCENCYLSAVY